MRTYTKDTKKGPGLRRVRPRRLDAITVLTVYLILTCAIPSYLTIPALGSVGRPGTLWSLAAVLWWGWHQLQRPLPRPSGSQPVRIMLCVFLAVALVSYAIAMLNGLPVKEESPADSGLIRLAGWAGILLIANDGIPDRFALLTLVRRIALVGGLMAALGLLQFWTGRSLIDWISIPGFSADASIANVDIRGGFTRAAGTASHPLEYGVVLSMSLPIALTLALGDATTSRFARWWPVIVIAFASILSVSRSALIAVVIGLVVLVPSWPKPIRRKAWVAAAVLMVAVYFLVPGLIGTLRGLFTGVSDDSSIASRTNSYATAFGVASHNPLFGRGFGTFLPEYMILDNQFLALLIELGLAGLVSMLALIGAGLVCAARSRVMEAEPLMRQMSQAIAASLAAGACTYAFFDGLGFPMAAGLVFLMLGISGAMWRIARSDLLLGESADGQ